MLYQFPTCGGLKFKILCAIWECQSFTKEKKGLGKILHSSLKAHSHSCARHNFSPLMAKQACGEKKVPTTCGFATRGRNFFFTTPA